MAVSSNICYTILFVLVSQSISAPTFSSRNTEQLCSSAKLIAPSQSSLVYKYKTEVKMSVANGQFDMENQYTADVHIKSLGDCNYALQLRNVKITETKDEKESQVTSSAQNQRALENTAVRFRWIDGFLVALEADSSARVENVNFIKGVLSALQVQSPIPSDNENIVREEDVLGVCTTTYRYSEQAGSIQVKKTKDLITCVKDKLHLGASPVLTSLLGPLLEETFTAKSRYVCQTEIRDKTVQSVNCKTVEVDEDKNADKNNSSDDNSSEENDDNDDNEEISTKLVSIKQELKLQSGAVANVDVGSIRRGDRQTLQFVPTPSFDRSNQPVSALIKKIQDLLDSKGWNEFAASQFVQVTNELRRMDRANLNAFKNNADLRLLTPSLLKTIYASDPAAAPLNFDSQTKKFSNPLSVYYLDDPSTELVDQIVQAAQQVTINQVRDFVSLAATILKTYKNRETHNRDADAKIREFQRGISRFLVKIDKERVQEIVSVLAAYAQLGLYEERIRQLAVSDQAPLEVQYHAYNALRHISEDFIAKDQVAKVRTDIQNALLRKLQSNRHRNAVRIWAFEALYTPFIFNPEEDDPTLSDALEKALESIVNEPLNQVNGYIWSVLKYSSLDRRCPLRGLAARLRTGLADKKKYTEQATLSSRQVQLDIPLRKNYRAALEASIVFENDRATPSYISLSLSFDGIRRETRRLEWVKAAMVIENLDWNVADYFLRLDPLNPKQSDDEAKETIKRNLPPALKRLQDAYDKKDEDPDPSVHLVLQLFGADFRINDATAKVQDILRDNIRSFLRNKLLDRMKELSEEKPVYRLPLEIGSASAAANGLTLYRVVQLGILADLQNEFADTRDENGLGKFLLKSKSAISASLTMTREVSSPLSSVGETVQIGVLSNVPFEYSLSGSATGRIRELNFPKDSATALATDFQYLVRTSDGIEAIPNQRSAGNEPSCTPSPLYRTLGLRFCLELNPFRSIQLGSRATYPLKITLNKDPSIQKWRFGWRFNADDAPQYEVAIEKVGTTGTYPGLGISASKIGNNFDIKVLTGLKSFTVKGTQNGNQFSGKVLSNDGKEVMTTSGTLSIDNNGFKLDSKLTDISTRRDVVNLVAEVLPNKGDGLTTNIALTTPDKSKSFKIHFRGDLYKANRKLFHVAGGANLGQTTYDGKIHFERDENNAHIELSRSVQLSPGASPLGYEFVYDRKTKEVADARSHAVKSHIVLKSGRGPEIKVANLVFDFSRSKDKSDANLQSTLDFVLLSREPPVQEQVTLEYSRQSVRSANQAKRLLSPQAQLKLALKTKSNFFNVLLDHRHRRSSEPSKKGPVTLPPTFEIENKIHIAADSEKLFPNIPRPFAFEVLSDLDFDLLNKIDYKAEYNFPRRQRSASFTYNSQIDRVVDNHHFHGTSRSELLWDNKKNRASATGVFSICTGSRTLTTHWDIDTNLVQDKKDAELDLVIRFDRQPKLNAPKSFIGAYNLSIKAPKHEGLQSLDLLGNLTRQDGLLETYNSLAFRKDRKARHLNLNAAIHRNRTGDGALKTNIVISLPLKNLPYITHQLSLERDSPNGRVSQIKSQLLAEPVTSHFLSIGIDRSDASRPPKVTVENEFEYLRANGDNLYGLSHVQVHRWKTLHSFGVLKRNTDLLHKHSIGYIFSKKTRKVALSLESPQLSGNPLSIIGELTIDRENRIGKMQWPQEFGIQLEFGTPLTSLTGIHAYYNLPMFSNEDEQTVDGTIGLKIASAKIDPISLYIHSRGSLNSTLHISESLKIGQDIAVAAHLTAQYNPLMASQVSLTANTKYYGSETHNSIYALFKQHQVTVRGVLNTSEYKDYRYEMDIGFDSEGLIGHTERSDGEKVVISDIDAKKCTAASKYARCYKGDIVLRTDGDNRDSRGSFDVSWGSGAAKLDVQVQNAIEIRFDHAHAGRVRDLDFNSKTNIDVKLQSGRQGSFRYSGAVDKQDGKWNAIQLDGSATDPRTGKKALATKLNMVNKADRRSGSEQRTLDFSYERDQPIFDWSSQSASCPNQANEVLHGICRTINFKVKANNDFVRRIRQRLDLPVDARLSNANGQVDYDGKLQLNLKANPRQGPHTATLDLNRLSEDAVDVDVSYQPRSQDTAMGLKLKAKLPRQSPIAVDYTENRRSATNYNGVLKYSFNANDASSEKTYQCEVDRPSLEDFSIDCKGERTTLAIDIDRNAGKSKVYVDLNRFAGERVGFELQRDPQTQQLDATLYTFVSSWNIKRDPGKQTVLTVKQKGSEVFRIEGNKLSPNELQVKFSPSGVNLAVEWDKDGIFTVRQTAPTQRDVLSVYVDRARIRPYLPSLRNQDRPSLDIDEPQSQSRKPLVEIALGSEVLLSLSQALDKIGSHNGLYGLDTIKKTYKLSIGDAKVTVYSIQHWKTHGEDTHLPESYAIRLINDANGNMVQLSTQRWDQTRMISKVGHSFDGGRTLTTDLKIDRDYGVEVGSLYFFRSLGYRNIEGMRNLRNVTKTFLKKNWMDSLNENLAATELAKNLRERIRSIVEVDYAAAKEVVQAWSKEPENSFLRRWSNRVGLLEFFNKYPTYTSVSNEIRSILAARHNERVEFWRGRFDAIINENRLQSLTERVEKVRQQVIETLSARAEVLLDRFLPAADQSAIDKRIADFVGNLLERFKKSTTQRRDAMKALFKAIDDASKGPENQWFRTLVADIDSAAFAAASDTETNKMFKRLDDSSKLFINNIQQISRRISKRRENIRERVRNAIRHVPRAYMNGTNFEILFPVGRQPGSYAGTSELLLGIGSLLRNRDQAFQTMRAILVNRLEARSETFQNYLKALKSLVKRIFKRDPALTPEFKGFITETGDALNVQTDYVYLNPACDYVLAHDFADLKFSFRFSNGKVYSMIPTQSEIGEYQCSETGRVRICCDKDFCVVNVPMYYGGRVDGALGDVRDRSEQGRSNLNKWLLSDCPEARREPPRRDSMEIPECADPSDDNVKFCRSFVQEGIRRGKSKYELLTQVQQARREAA